MTTLILVRHGQASFGAANYDALSATGVRQSRVLGDYLARTGFRCDFAYAGTMARQQSTAAHAFESMGDGPHAVVTDPAFNEYDFEGILRGYLPLVAREHPEIAIERRELFQQPKLFQAAFEKAVGCWLDGRDTHGALELETWRAFSERVRSGLHAIATPDRSKVVAFTSGGVIAVALREALQLDDAATFRMNWRIYNASMHVFRMGKHGLSLLGFNNVAPLELANDPALLTFR